MSAPSLPMPTLRSSVLHFARFIRSTATPQRLSFLDTPDPGVPLKNIYLQTDLDPLDVLGSIAGFADIDEIRKNAVRFDLFGRAVSVISREDLIRAKEALGRPKDLLVAQELRAIAQKQQP